MNEIKKNKEPLDACDPKTEEKIQQIQKLRPAVSETEIKKAIDEAGTSESEIMTKLDQKDHS